MKMKQTQMVKMKFWKVKSQNANNSKTIKIRNVRIFVCGEIDRPGEGGTKTYCGFQLKKASFIFLENLRPKVYFSQICSYFESRIEFLPLIHRLPISF